MANEVMRQGVHVLTSLILLLISLFTTAEVFALICAVFFLLSAVSLFFKPKVIKKSLRFLEKGRSRRFPGKGVLGLFLGAMLSALIFPAYLTASLLILALPDAVSTVVGSYYGKKRLPWAPGKSWIGSLAFFAVSGMVLFNFTSFWYLGSIVLTLLESVDYSDILFLDDNLILPLVTGALLILI